MLLYNSVKAQSSELLEFSLQMGLYEQMYCNTEAPKVVDPQNTTYHVPSQVIEDQDLPYGIAIGIQDGRCLGYQSIGSSWVVTIRQHRRSLVVKV